MMNKIKIFVCAFAILLLGVCLSQNVFADGWINTGSLGSGGSGGGGSGDCGTGQNNMYLLECTGYSWIHYSPTEEARNNKQAIYIKPGRDAWISEKCIDLGGFWHLGRNVQGFGHGQFADNNYLYGYDTNSNHHYKYFSVSGAWGHMDTYTPGMIASRYSWSSYKGSYSTLRQDLYVDDVVMYKADKIAPSYYSSDVFDSFKEAFREVNGYEYTDSYYPDSLYAFCSAPDPTPPNECEIGDPECPRPPANTVNVYYVKSGVSVQKVGGSYSGGNETEKIGHGDGVDDEWADETFEVENNVFKVGDTARISFNHKIFSNKSRSNQSWRVYGKKWEDFMDWTSGNEYESSGINFVDDYNVLYEGSVNLSTGCGTDCYTTNSINVKSDSFTVKFNEVGTWKYCEILSYGGAQSAMCAYIEVNDDDDGCVGSCHSHGGNSYYVKSNVGIRDEDGYGSDYRTTDIVLNNGSISSSIVVPKDTVSTIVFSHNVYSKNNSGSPAVSITTPSFSGSAQLQGGSASSMQCGVKNGSISGWQERTSFGEDEPEGVKYIGNPRNCNDGGSSPNYFISRDSYVVKFTSVGDYEFCETISVGGEQKATVCARVKVTADGGVCSDWTPSSYTSSINSQTNGYTSVVSKVKNIGGGYSNWTSSVYAKPGDRINWIHCYYPGVQYLHNKVVTKDNSHPEPSSMSPTTNYLNNGDFASFYTWQNKYTISQSNMYSATSAIKTYNWNSFVSNTGSLLNDQYATTIQKTEDNAYVVEYGSKREDRAGKIITETITSGIPSSVSRDNSGSGPHKWSCNWGTSCSKCGTGKSCSGSGENRTCVTYCKSCYLNKCKHNEKFYRNSRDNTPVTSHADVKVPYNFRNSISVSLSHSTVYAGEKETISSLNTYIYPVRNNTTNGTYATQVDDAMIKLVSYVYNTDSNPSSGDGEGAKEGVGSGSGKSYDICDALGSRVHTDSSGNGQCTTIDSKNNFTMNPEGNASSTVTEPHERSFSSPYNVYDEEAGMYFCVVAAVYPYTSGAETNLSSSGSDSWYISRPGCAKIAKRPTFQVRGGSVYSNGSINTGTIIKNNLESGLWGHSYSPTGGNEVVFSSWAEQSVILGGVTGSFASGAATNKKIVSGEVRYGSEEGVNNSYCSFRVPLSFANYNDNGGCPNTQQTGNSGITVSKNKDSIINYWWPLDIIIINKNDMDINTDCTETTNLAGDKICDTYKNGNFNVKSVNIMYAEPDSNGGLKKPIPHIVRSDSNITITGNIVYTPLNNTSISSAEMMPKVIIYAKGNIYIRCAVTRIDAILIAEGVVNTCSDGGSESSADRSNQLIINGAILANQVQLNRTFGASTGKYSGIPAEIINYDTSFILWGRTVSEADDFQTYSTVYQQELAPRY